MTRNAASWILAGCLAGIGLVLGFFRGRAIMKTYRNICRDLKKAGIEPTQAELQMLFKDLYRNPKRVVTNDPQEVSRRIKEQHVQLLLSSLRPLWYGFAVLVVVGIVAVLLFQHLWPNR